MARSRLTTGSSGGNKKPLLDDPEVRFEEKLRRKAFAHYDCQSISANLNYASKLCTTLAKRRNTTTGASAASVQSKKDGSDDENIDEGDGRSNELVLSCPFFRNELGGEEERTIALNRTTCDRHSFQFVSKSPLLLHQPNMACGLSLLEGANDRRWKIKACPYQRLTNEKSFIIENYDIGATYYREHFSGLEHQNWFGVDESLGPVAISIRKERCASPLSISSSDQSQTSQPQQQIKHQYRLIIRTSELTVLRGTVHEDCIPNLSSSSRHNHHNNHHAKEVLEYVTTELALPTLRLGVSNADEQLLKLDEQVLTRTYKVGVLYCKNGQSTEEEMYNNEHSSPAFDEFLSCLGEKVRLKGFDKYRAGLDSKTDTTGLHSIYTTFNDYEMHFHVSTLLPYTPNNRQQLLRKRHIGNDIITIVFQEPDAKPFTPKTIRSHFQHVFIVVRLLPNTGGPTRYAVSVTRSKEVPVFGPPIIEKGIYTKSRAFTDFLLSKIINAENAAHRSEKFRSMAQRTRHEYLKDLAQNYITSTTINDLSSGTSAGAKLVSSIFGAAKKSKGNRNRDSQFIGNTAIKGAIVWEMSVEDYGQAKLVDCLVAISSDTLVIIEEASKEVVFVCPNATILGWTSHPSFVKIFYHQGECILLKCKDPDLDEIGEIVTRLKTVTRGCETQELILRRNSHGHLGFHVGHDGIVSDVEGYAFAWQVGLRVNFRIVEICKVVISTLDHDQIRDLLKTSITVTVTVLPPYLDGSPRRGCNLQNCSYLTVLTNGNGGDYENIGGMLERFTPTDNKSRSRSHTPSKNPSSIAPPSRSNGSKSLPTSPEERLAAATRANPQMMMQPNPSTIYSNSSGPGLGPMSSGSLGPSYRYNSLTPRKHNPVMRKHSGKFSAVSESSHLPKHFGNLVSWWSELSLADKSYASSSKSSLTRDAPTLTPLHQSQSRSQSHHFVKLNGNSLSTANNFAGSSMNVNPRPRMTSDYNSDTSSSHDAWSLPHMPPNTSHHYSSNGNLVASMNNKANNRADPEWDLICSRSKSPKVYNIHSQKASVLSGPIHLQHSRSHPNPFARFNENTSVAMSNSIMQKPSPLPKPVLDYTQSPSSETSSNAGNYPSKSWSPPQLQPNQSLQTNGHFGSGRDSGTGNLVMTINQANSTKEKEKDIERSIYNRTTKTTSKASYGNQHNLRGGVNERMRVKNGSTKGSGGSSCSNSSSSTLQEDLMKLINPEYLSDCMERQESTPSAAESNSTHYSTPYSSLERNNGNKDGGSDVILTVAQPAHVISSEPSSPSDTKNERITLSSSASTSTRSPSSTISKGSTATYGSSSSKDSPTSFETNGLPLLTDVQGDIDWPSLVDTATKALTKHQNAEKREKPSYSSAALEESLAWLNEFGSNLPGTPSQLPSESVKELENTVKKLQIDLVREQSDKASLEDEMEKLRLENMRLHEESQTAAAQLRKFTEWFFQNINAK
ncbi:Signal-induced proliferation-associated 1-like protein 2 [Halotydeus destructor]|nr:Signal-induced proliferation-associated 1-like protein 2 [Halotydeus destructor]